MEKATFNLKEKVETLPCEEPVELILRSSETQLDAFGNDCLDLKKP